MRLTTSRRRPSKRCRCCSTPAAISTLATTSGGRGKGAGQTALFGAAFWGWNDVVSFLVSKGARIDVADGEGRTPVDAAMGRAGGHDRGSTIVTFEDTAELLEKLCSEQAECNVAALKSQS